MKKKKKGMTLIEVVAAMAILAIISMAITSTMLMAVNGNADNKSKLYSNRNSRNLIEVLKAPEFKPDPPHVVGNPVNPREYPLGWHYLAFDNDDQVVDFVKNKVAGFGGTASLTEAQTLTEAITLSGRTTQKFVMTVKVSWNFTDNVYQVDVYSWEVARDELSKIKRTILIAPHKLV